MSHLHDVTLSRVQFYCQLHFAILTSWLKLAWLIHVLIYSALTQAATVTHDFNITWVTANPDGMVTRPTIGINGQWPPPIIHVNIGDRLVVNALNSLGNQSTSLHFHGIFMRDTPHMDGPVQVSQCPIPPGSRFTYNFTVSGLDIQHKYVTADPDRSINQAHIGTTHTSTASIPTA